jgi:hypothetical protein
LVNVTIPGHQSGAHRYFPARVTDLLAESGQRNEQRIKDWSPIEQLRELALDGCLEFLPLNTRPG